MSEPTIETAVEQPDATPATDATPGDLTPPNLGDAGKQAIDRMKAERDAARREARTNADAAQRLQEIEDAQKSEQQRLTDRQTAVERERDEARADGLRYKAAAKHGIGEDYFDLLGSGDEETITARAERVGQLLKVAGENEQLKVELEALRQGRPAPIGGRPVQALKPGATPEDNQSEDDVLYASLYGK